MEPRIKWQDNDLAAAFVDVCGGKSVTLYPETASQLAGEIRSKVKLGTIAELMSLVKETIANLFENENEESTAIASLDHMVRMVDEVEKRVAALPPEEAERVISQLANDVILPAIQGASERVTNSANKHKSLLAENLQKQKEIMDNLEDDAILDALYDKYTSLEKGSLEREDARAQYFKAKAGRSKKAEELVKLVKAINESKSILILLDASNKAINSLKFAEQGIQKDGRVGYLTKILKPTVERITSTLKKAKDAVILPELEEKERHQIDKILKHHHTNFYQESKAPTTGAVSWNITLEDLKKSPMYAALIEDGATEEQILDALNELNSKSDTFYKGLSIAYLKDPPASPYVGEIYTTLNSSKKKTTEGQGYKSSSQELLDNQPFQFQSGKIKPSIKVLQPSGETKTQTFVPETKGKRYEAEQRAIFEAANPKAHWVMLLANSTTKTTDQLGRSPGQAFMSNLTPEQKEEKVNKDKALQLDKEAFEAYDAQLNAVLHNPATPDWLLMKIASNSANKMARRIATTILRKQRGWNDAIGDKGRSARDPETNSVKWVKNSPDAVGSIDAISVREVRGDAGIQSQIKNIQNTIKNRDTQLQQLGNQINQLKQQTEQDNQNIATLQAQDEQAGEQSMNMAVENAAAPAMAPPMASMRYRVIKH